MTRGPGRTVIDSESERPIWEVFQRCHACGRYTRVDTTPQGGRYTAPASDEGTDATTGKTIYLAKDELGGCQNCGTPIPFDGAELGDQARSIFRNKAMPLD